MHQLHMWSWGQNGSSRYAGAFAKHEGGGRIHARHAPCLLATSPALVLVPSRPRYPQQAPRLASRAQVMEHGDAGKRRRLMEESASTEPTLYTRAQLEEACMNAGMDATERALWMKRVTSAPFVATTTPIFEEDDGDMCFTPTKHVKRRFQPEQDDDGMCY